MPYDLKLGPLQLPTFTGPVKESVGDDVETVGRAIIAGQVAPQAFPLAIPVHGLDTLADPYSAGDRLRRQLRALVRNGQARLQGLYVDFAVDPDINGVIVPGRLSLEYTDAGVSLSDYQLEGDAYLVGGLRTHRMARQVFATVKSSTPGGVDYKGLIVGPTGVFAQGTPQAVVYLPVGSLDWLLNGAPIAASGSRATRDGLLPFIVASGAAAVAAADRAAVSFEVPESCLGLADVRLVDRRANPNRVTRPQVESLLRVYGHSMSVGIPGTLANSSAQLVANRLAAAMDNHGQGGSRVAFDDAPSEGGVMRVYQFEDGSRGKRPAMVWWGVNDIRYEGLTPTNAFKNAMRSAICMLRARELHHDEDATHTYSSTGWAVLNLAGQQVGSQVHLTSTPGAYVDVAVPPTFEGGEIDLLFTNSGTGGGGWQIYVDGSLYSTVDYRTVNVSGEVVTSAARIQGLARGAHRIRALMIASAGSGGGYDGWIAADRNPGGVAVVSALRSPSYPTATFTPTDQSIIDYNAALKVICAEFDQRVRYADADAVINKNATYFSGDGIHPNDTGYALAAGPIYDALVLAHFGEEEAYGWEYIYGADQPLSGGDVPMLDNGACRVRYVTDMTALGAFALDQWSSTLDDWTEIGRLMLQRYDDGGVSRTFDQLVDADVLEWTPERAVVRAVMKASADAKARGEVILTLQRGWSAPKVEVYANALTNGTASFPSLLYFAKDNTGPTVVGTGTQTNVYDANVTTFPNFGNITSGVDNFAFISTPTGTVSGAVHTTDVAAAAGGAANFAYAGTFSYLIFTSSSRSYIGVKLHAGAGLIAREAEAMTLLAGTSVVADGAASGGQAVAVTSAAGTTPDLSDAPATADGYGLLAGTYRFAARIKTSGGQGQIGVTTVSGNAGSQATFSNTSYAWVVATSDFARASGDTVYIQYASNDIGTRTLTLDRVFYVPLLRTAAFDGVRDSARALATEALGVPTLVAR